MAGDGLLDSTPANLGNLLAKRLSLGQRSCLCERGLLDWVSRCEKSCFLRQTAVAVSERARLAFKWLGGYEGIFKPKLSQLSETDLLALSLVHVVPRSHRPDPTRAKTRTQRAHYYAAVPWPQPGKAARFDT